MALGLAQTRRDLIENGSQIARNVKQDAGKNLRQIARELDFVNVLSRLRLVIRDIGPRRFFSESGNSSLEIIDVMLCTNER